MQHCRKRGANLVLSKNTIAWICSLEWLKNGETKRRATLSLIVIRRDVQMVTMNATLHLIDNRCPYTHRSDVYGPKEVDLGIEVIPAVSLLCLRRTTGKCRNPLSLSPGPPFGTRSPAKGKEWARCFYRPRRCQYSCQLRGGGTSLWLVKNRSPCWRSLGRKTENRQGADRSHRRSLLWGATSNR